MITLRDLQIFEQALRLDDRIETEKNKEHICYGFSWVEESSDHLYTRLDTKLIPSDGV